MNSAMKFGAASALALAGVAAHASISQPATGSSDAILFAEVVNAAGTAAVASYAGDTGISIATLEAGGYNGTVLSGDANLAKLFAADTAAGDTIDFAVLGAQYIGNATAPNFKTAGVAQFLTTTNGNSTSSLANDTSNSLVKFGGLNGDISTINSNSGGAKSVEGANPATAGVWDVTNTLGTAYWDGGATNNSNTGSTVANLYYVTAGTPPGNTTRVAYTEVETASFSQAGLTLTSLGTITSTPTPPVPLPAAVWLLGSGLLGLTGVARRKLKV
jgi:hypothetical protein